MSYKLIALDIDGTIRSDEYPLSERTRLAVSRARDAGALITLATGRTFKSALKQSSDLNITTPIASSQGAHVVDPLTSKVLWHVPLTQQMTRIAVDAVRPYGLDIMGYRDNAVFVADMTDWAISYGKRNDVDVNAVGDLGSYTADSMTRLVVRGDEDVIEGLEVDLKAKFDSTELYITRSLPYFCEILHPDGGKDKALNWLCESKGIRSEETVAFGNGYNDVQMLEWAGLSVAIGGAVPQVLEVADTISPPIEEDGAAQIIEGLLDSGLIG
jgi:Cof subfamily protein (haloacid dehalogenase superfamily)